MRRICAMAVRTVRSVVHRREPAAHRDAFSHTFHMGSKPRSGRGATVGPMNDKATESLLLGALGIAAVAIVLALGPVRQLSHGLLLVVQLVPAAGITWA